MSDVINLDNNQLRQLQLIELEMLMEIDRVCRKNKIKYSLDGGTLLGAVRHKGFIPWDDDVDIMFTHEEYEKFYRACQYDLDTSKFFLQDFRTDPGYRWGYGKLRRLGTEYVKKGQEHLKQRTGVCIDIFDYQYLPDNPVSKKMFRTKMFCLRKIMYSAVGKYEEKSFIMRSWYSILSLLPIKMIQNIRLKDVNKMNGRRSERMSCEMFLEPAKMNGIKSKLFEEYVNIEFEGMQFMAIKEFDDYLTTSYGNYMELPPVEERKGVMNAVKYRLIPINYLELYEKYKDMMQN